MKYFQLLFRHQSIVGIIFITLTLIVFQSCNTNQTEKPSEVEGDEKKEDVMIITNVMDFEMTDSLSAGWHTFKYENRSAEPHFFLVEKYPEGKTIEDGKKEVLVPFQMGMNKIVEGKMEEAGAEFAKLPEWYGQVQFCGGSGIVSPKETSTTTLFLEPGYYVFECYMKMAGAIFHSGVGMVKEVKVNEVDSLIMDVEIDSFIKLDISSTDGIVVPDDITAGLTTFQVNFIDQIVHENFVGHDVNLARIDDAANLEELEAWMNWANPDGLMGQVPSGVTFLGGVNDMSQGDVGYFTADLQSGNKYLFISEVPNTLQKNMLKVFTVN